MKVESSELTWTAFPMKESVGKAVFFWVVVLFTVWAVWWNLQSLLLTFVATLVLLGALTSFYLPTTYMAGVEGVSWKRLTGGKKLEWDRVRSVADEKDGLFLSPFPVKSRMENFRGIYLPYRGNREEVLAVVKHYSPNVKGLPGGGDGVVEGKNVVLESPSARNYFGHRK